MRNAATFDDDLGYEAAPRKPAPRKRSAAGAGKAKKGAKRPRFDMHRIARFAAVGMAATMALGIMVNALVLQKGHHPAPLFGKAPAASAASPKAPSASTAARSEREEPASELTPAKPQKTIVATRDTDAPGSDEIGRLLAGGAPPATGKAKTDGKTISGAQRALTKLGFKVPATGAVGPATKKAIEAFEKDRHMPVKGELSHHLVKVLAAESGIKID